MRDTGLRSMARVVVGIAGAGREPSDDTEPLPEYYPAPTVLAATALCVLLVAVFGGLRVLLAELSGFTTVLSGLWMLSAALMFLPTAVAFLVRPARRIAGLVAGLVAGAVLGTPAGLWVAGLTGQDVWGIAAGLAVGALVLAAVFGLATRPRVVAPG